MSKRIYLSVPTPCHENWDNMSPAEKGRFCGSCQKQVVDFSNMTDREVATFFKKKSTGSVCGRFMQDQLQRDFEIPKKRIPWLKYFFQFLIPAFLISCKENITGKVKVAEVGTAERRESHVIVGMVLPDVDMEFDTIFQPIPLPDTSESITISEPSVIFGDVEVALTDIDKVIPIRQFAVVKGIVVDEQNNPVPYASIVIKGTTFGAEADSEGQFIIKDEWIKENRVLEISSVGFTPKNVALTRNNTKDSMNIQLNTAPVMQEVVIVGYGTIKKETITGLVKIDSTEARKVENKKIGNDTGSDFLSERLAVTVYPNPVQNGSSVTINIKSELKGLFNIRVISLTGQSLLSKQVQVEKENNLVNIHADARWSAGVYVIQLTDQAGKLIKAEKLIIR